MREIMIATWGQRLTQVLEASLRTTSETPFGNLTSAIATTLNLTRVDETSESLARLGINTQPWLDKLNEGWFVYSCVVKPNDRILSAFADTLTCYESDNLVLSVIDGGIA
jgi:hypothetical protein